MNEQITILLFLIAATGITLYLYIWKAKKEVEYKNDGSCFRTKQTIKQITQILY